MTAGDLRLYGIIDPERTGSRDPVALIRQAVTGACGKWSIRS
ncbi:hypothetical protein [Microvirga tunisiensis]|nr:hypothetical protein [Microvirga tunisiensis]